MIELHLAERGSIDRLHHRLDLTASKALVPPSEYLVKDAWQRREASAFLTGLKKQEEKERYKESSKGMH